jgi:hypothetical protein
MESFINKLYNYYSMPLKENSEYKSILVCVKKTQQRYLKNIGVAQSSFVRQAIDAHERGDWEYKYIEE